MARVLFHVDLNAFFASAEELRHPEFKDKPLAVGSLSSRGVLSTCNYKAREKGLHSAMPVMQAKKICPELELVPGDYAYYRKLSSQFFDYLRTFTGRLEILSIDECFLDVTDVISRYPRPLDLAVEIQQGVYGKLGLKCSIGVGPTRFLAKMASDLHKPMGITVVRKSDIEKKLYPLDVSACMGIGKKTVTRLKEKGIETIGDLMDEDNEQDVKQVLQNAWPDIRQKLQGRSSSELIFSSTRKSVSHSRTFNHDLYTLEEVLEQISILCHELSDSMAKARKKGTLLSVVLRDTEFSNQVHSVRLSSMTNSYAMLYEAASRLCLQYFEPVGYRHLGVSVGSLQDEDQIILQPTLFEPAMKTTDDIIRSLNAGAQGKLFKKASDLMKDKEKEKEQSV